MHSGIAASALAHLSILALVVVFAEVHPFSSVTAEPIAVDIVSHDEAMRIPNDPEPPRIPEAQQPSERFDLASKSPDASSPPPAATEPAAHPQKQATLSTARPDPQPATAQPQPPPASTAPAYVAPQPDLSIKYHVMLGLPPVLPAASSHDPADDSFDAQATKTADISSNLVADFRRYLRTCATLPASVALSAKISIKLRVQMTPEGRLAAAPIPIEGSPSVQGLALAQSAIKALETCQPYQMLPANRYGEWKVLDLSFTPQDFAG
jgi:hypothetical protein